MVSRPSIEEDLLTCGICFETYEEPKILPCVHSFCLKCLSSYMTSVVSSSVAYPGFPCPSCREFIKIPDPTQPADTWGKQFKTNFFINSLISNVQGGNETPSGTESRMKLCFKHQDRHMDLFCVYCDEFICVTCAAVNHRGCLQIITLREVAQEKRANLTQHQHIFKTHLTQSKIKRTEQQAELDLLRERHTAAKCKIADTVLSLKAQLEAEEKRCLDQLNKAYSEEEARQFKLLNDTDNRVKVLTKMSSAVDSLITGNDDVKVVERYSALENYRQQLSSSTAPSCDVRVYDIQYTPNWQVTDSLQKSLSKMGNLEIHEGIRRLSFPEITPPPSPAAPTPAGSPSATVQSDQQQEYMSKPNLRATSKPTLVKMFSAKIKGDKSQPGLKDAALVRGDVFVVTDSSNTCVKSFYTHGEHACHSRLVTESPPHGVAILSGNMVVVTVPKAKQIATISVTPNLILQHISHTEKKYWGICAVSAEVLAVSTCPGTGTAVVDLISREGKGLRTVHTGTGLFSNPLYLMTLPSGDIVVSDCTVPTVLCLRQNGSIIFRQQSTKGLHLKRPMGMACDKYGTILLLDRLPALAVMSLDGIIIGHILTKKDGLNDPKAIALSENNCIYIADDNGKIYVYRL